MADLDPWAKLAKSIDNLERILKGCDKIVAKRLMEKKLRDPDLFRLNQAGTGWVVRRKPPVKGP